MENLYRTPPSVWCRSWSFSGPGQNYECPDNTLKPKLQHPTLSALLRIVFSTWCGWLALLLGHLQLRGHEVPTTAQRFGAQQARTQTDRQTTDRQTDRPTDRQADRQTDRNHTTPHQTRPDHAIPYRTDRHTYMRSPSPGSSFFAHPDNLRLLGTRL